MTDAEIRSREQLFEAVWNEPVSTLARRYGLSGVGLSKICRRAGIPIPSRGHWAQVAAGKRVRVPRLPAARPEQELRRPLVPQDAATAEAAATRAAELFSIKQAVSRDPLPEIGPSSHPLARAAHSRLSRHRDWDAGEIIRSAPSEIVAIHVSREAVDRACRLANALFLELERVGLRVFRGTEGTKTLIQRGATSLPFEITEHLARTKHERTRREELARNRWSDSFRLPGPRPDFPVIPEYDYTPTGRLTITVGGYPKRNWRDSAVRGLELRLGEVVAGILTLADEAYEKELARQRREQEAKARRDAYEQAITKWTKERRLFRGALKDSKRWEEAERLRRYIDAVSRSGIASVDDMPTDVWASWATKKANWLDPLCQVPDEIMDAPKPERW